MATDADGPVPGAQVRHIDYTVPSPGSIPAGAVVTGVQQRTQLDGRGFIPGRKAEAEVIVPEPLDEDAIVTPEPEPVVDITVGVCDICGKDFRDKADPAKSVQSHKGFVHKKG